MATQKILVVDDEADILDLIAMNLKRQGFEIIAASDGIAAVEKAKKEVPELIILDLMLPGMGGFSVFKEIKADARLTGVPVIILTARGELNDKISGLELGADDYITKPFSPKELILRVKSLKVASEASLKRGAFHLERDSLKFFLEGQPVELTATEFKLLRLMVEADGKVQEREHLLNEVWGYKDTTMTRTLDTHIKRLREKLESFSDCIQTVRGVGYCFVKNGASK